MTGVRRVIEIGRNFYKYSFAFSHVVNLTSEMLKKFCYHKIVVRIWDTRDKFGPKARFDRPRAFKFPPPKPGKLFRSVSPIAVVSVCMKWRYNPKYVFLFRH